MAKKFKVYVSGIFKREPIYVEANDEQEARQLADASMAHRAPDIEVLLEDDPDHWGVDTPDLFEQRNCEFVTAESLIEETVGIGF